MINANKILRQINSLTEDLITTGLCDDQNFPHVITKPKKMLMCHKVTQKNLIDSSPLFRVIVSKGDAENASNFSYQKPILALQENVLKSV